jgi:hypothetical protein
MATYTKRLLSGSTDGRAIPVAATATPGTEVHTAVAGTNNFDEVYVWANNPTNQNRTLTIELGGVVDPGDLVPKNFRIPANSPPIPILTGQVLNNGAVIRAFADQAGGMNLSGFVNRIEY